MGSVQAGRATSSLTKAVERAAARLAAIFSPPVEKVSASKAAFVDKIERSQKEINNGQSKTFTVEEFDNL